MRKEFDGNADARRLTLSIARTEADKASTVQLLGAYSGTVVVAAPVNPDGSLVPVQLGQSWICRTFQMISAFRFVGVVVKVAFDPFPHVCLKLQKEIEQRRVRTSPRARTSLTGELHVPDAMPCYVADLSATGARVAIDYPLALAKGSTVKLAFSIPMIPTKRELSLEATIINALGASDTRFPEVSFYGIHFKSTSEIEALALLCLRERRARVRSEQPLAVADERLGSRKSLTLVRRDKAVIEPRFHAEPGGSAAEKS